MTIHTNKADLTEDPVYIPGTPPGSSERFASSERFVSSEHAREEQAQAFVAPETRFQMSSVEETVTAKKTQASGKMIHGKTIPVFMAEWLLVSILMYLGREWCKQNIEGFTGGPGIASIIVAGVLAGLAFPSARAIVRIIRQYTRTPQVD